MCAGQLAWFSSFIRSSCLCVAASLLACGSSTSEPSFDDSVTDHSDCSIDDEPGPAPVLLATGVPAPSAIDLDDNFIWFAAFVDGSVGRALRDGTGPPEVFMDGIPSPTAVVANDDAVFVTTAPGSILRIDKQTAQSVELASGQARPQHLILLDDELLWVNEGTGSLGPSGPVPDGNAGLHKISLTNPNDAEALLLGEDWAGGFAVDNRVAYMAVASDGQGTRVVAVPLDGGAPWTIATVAGALRGVAAYGGYVYWTRPLACAVHRATAEGGPVERIAPNENMPSFIVADELGVVWTNSGRQSQGFAGSQVVAALWDGSDRHSISIGRNAYAVVADGSAVFFSNNELDGDVARVTR